GAVIQSGNTGGVIAAIFQPLERFQDDGRYVARARDADNAAHYFFSNFLAFCFSRKALAQSAISTCLPRATASASAATSLVITEPAPVMAPSPTLTGATKAVSEPIKAPAPISVMDLVKPS